MASKENRCDYPSATIFDSKRILGLSFSDPAVQDCIKTAGALRIIPDGNPARPIYDVSGKKIPPEHIAFLIIQELKAKAETLHGGQIDQAVITCPKQFTTYQRDLLKKAAEHAHLTVLQIINEPIAAALSYAVVEPTRQKIVLVFDFGGGTLDISILQIKPNSQGKAEPQVIGQDGDMHLGGQDIDNTLYNYVCSSTIVGGHPLDLTGNGEAQALLKDEIEKAKIALSATNASTYPIRIDNLTPTYSLQYTLTRAKLEEVCMPIFRRCKEITDRAINGTMLDGRPLRANDLTDLLLVGGSSKIPKMHELLSQYGVPIHSNNPELAVVNGAAMQAMLLRNAWIKEVAPVIDTVPYNYGIQSEEHTFVPIYKKGERFPDTRSRDFATVFDHQVTATFNIYAGDHLTDIRQNKFVGTCEISNLPDGVAGSIRFRVKLSFDLNQMLTIDAECTNQPDRKVQAQFQQAF